MVIDENETFKRFGYHSGKWSTNSSKLVVAVCDGCGLIREIRKRYSDKMCLKCACNTPARAAMLSRTHKDKLVSNEQKRKQSEAMTGRKQSVEHVTKRAQSLTGLKRTDEQKHNMSIAQKGRTFSEHHRRKLSASHTGLCASDETKQKMSEARKGVQKSDETKSRMSAAKMVYHPHRGVPMTLDERIGQSCEHQNIAVDDWDGFVAGIRDHVLPIHMCTKINEWFPGCEGHHLSRSLVVFIPTELHNHIWHNMKTGLGMAEMNALALQFAF